MGINKQGVRFLLHAKESGVDYRKSAMIGRQGLHLDPSEFKKILSKLNFSINDSQLNSVFNKSNGYAEEFLKYLGANEVRSFDNSDYEQATYVHDMNQKIPAEFIGQYSMVMEGGTLDHVFNFPVAIKNCMEMLEVGGHYIGITISNNMGSGFYQFSPELFFGVFTKENGFELVDMIVCEARSSDWYRIGHPRTSPSGRIELTNSEETYLLILAKKTKQCEIFKNTPQQSGYLDILKDGKNNSDHAKPMSIKRLIPNSIKRLIPNSIKRLIRCSTNRFSAPYYQKIKPLGKKNSNKMV